MTLIARVCRCVEFTDITNCNWCSVGCGSYWHHYALTNNVMTSQPYHSCEKQHVFQWFHCSSVLWQTLLYQHCSAVDQREMSFCWIHHIYIVNSRAVTSGVLLQLVIISMESHCRRAAVSRLKNTFQPITCSGWWHHRCERLSFFSATQQGPSYCEQRANNPGWFVHLRGNTQSSLSRVLSVQTVRPPMYRRTKHVCMYAHVKSIAGDSRGRHRLHESVSQRFKLDLAKSVLIVQLCSNILV